MGERLYEKECPVCGKMCGVKLEKGKIVEKYCKTCDAYHRPTVCTGEGCLVCKEISSIKDKL